jgi:hypothetical protein
MDFIFATQSIKRLLYQVLLVGVTFGIYFNLNVPDRYWTIWSAFFLSLIIWEGPLALRIKMMLQTGLAFILIAGLFGLLSVFPIIIPLGLCFLTIGSVIFSKMRTQYALSSLVIVLLAIISALTLPTMIANSQRMIMLGVGVLVVLLCHLLFYLRPIKETFRINIYASLKNLLSLNTVIFASLIDQQYKNNLYLFERRIHLQKNKCVQTFIAFNQRFPKNSHGHCYEKHARIIGQLGLLYDALLDCSMLRFRIKDHTILKVCEAELVGILHAINQVMRGWMKVFSRSWLRPKVNSKEHLVTLSQWIFKLEENYQHFLQAIAEDPLAFLLFVESLKSLAKEMENFNALTLCHPERFLLSS